MTELQKELELLSYRDIQARAKKLGLVANKKREELVASIINASSIEVNNEICNYEPLVIESDKQLGFNESKENIVIVQEEESIPIVINDSNSIENKVIDEVVEIESNDLVTQSAEEPVEVSEEKAQKKLKLK